MPIDLDRIAAYVPVESRRSIRRKDAVLYALAVGAGRQFDDQDDLGYLLSRAPRVLPSMAVVLSPEDSRIFELLELERPELMLHVEQRLTMFAPLRAPGDLIVRERFGTIADRGEKGALIELILEGRHADDNRPAFETRFVTLARGDGGFGGPPAEARAEPLPERAPDLRVDCATRPEQAFWYSLTGDSNPIHLDPAAARAAGLGRPILHGLCSYGVVCHALIAALAGGDPSRLRRLDLRFSAPIIPGETLQLELFHEGSHTCFRAVSAEDGRKLLDHGLCEIAV